MKIFSRMRFCDTLDFQDNHAHTLLKTQLSDRQIPHNLLMPLSTLDASVPPNYNSFGPLFLENLVGGHNEVPMLEHSQEIQDFDRGISSNPFSWHSKKYEDKTMKVIVEQGFHGPYISNNRWILDPHEYFMPKGPRKSRGWESKIKQLSQRGMIIKFNDVEYVSSEGFLLLVIQDKILFHLLPYAVSIYYQDKGLENLDSMVSAISHLQKNHDPYTTRSMDQIRNVVTRTRRAEKHNPNRKTLSVGYPSVKNSSITHIQEGNLDSQSTHKRTILRRSNEPHGTTSANLSDLNRKVVHSILDIYNVFPNLEGIQEPASLHDALVLCLRTLMKARFYRFSFKEKKADINMKDVTREVMADKELNLGILEAERKDFSEEMEKILTKNTEFAVDLYLLSDMAVDKWRRVRSLLVRKYSPNTKCPLPATIKGIPLPALWPSYNKVHAGLTVLDSKLPQYKLIKGLSNAEQIGYSFRKEDFSIALSCILKSKQDVHFEKKELLISIQDYQLHLKQANNSGINCGTPIIDGDTVCFKSVDVLKLLFCGDGYTDMPFAGADFRKSKIACFGILENFVDPTALQLFSNAWLLAFGEGIEDDTTVRKYCENLFQIFEEFSSQGFLYEDGDSGAYTLFKFEISFVADYKFLCLLLGIHPKQCWRCNGELENWWNQAPPRTLQQMIDDFREKKASQKHLPLSLQFKTTWYHCDPLHFSCALGRALVSDITSTAITVDNIKYKERVKSHLIYQHFSKQTEKAPIAEDYKDFLKLFSVSCSLEDIDKLSDHCYKKWVLFTESNAFSLHCSPSICTIQRLFNLLRTGIYFFGREVTGRPNKISVMGWHTAVILALMPEIGKILDLSSNELLRYNAMRKFNKMIHKRNLTQKHRQRAKQLYLIAFKDYEFMKKKTYLMLGWHFVHDIEENEIPGRSTCQRGERGNSEIKKMRLNHSNNKVIASGMSEDFEVYQKFSHCPKLTDTSVDNEDETQHIDSPWEMLHVESTGCNDSKGMGSDYIYQTIRGFNRKQFVYSKYNIRGNYSSGRLDRILKTIREGKFPKYDEQLRNSLTRTSPIIDSLQVENPKVNSVIKLSQRTNFIASNKGNEDRRNTSEKGKIGIVINLASCNSEADLSKYKVIDLKETARKQSISLGKRRLKAEITSLLWSEYTSQSQEEQSPKRARLGENANTSEDNSQITKPENSTFQPRGEEMDESGLEFINILKNQCSTGTASIVNKKFSIDLTMGDLYRLVMKEERLNDQCLNYYMLLIQEKLKQSSEFNHIEFLSTFFYSKLIQLSGYNFKGVEKWTKNMSLFSKRSSVIIPIHLIQAHWILGVIHIDIAPEVRIRIHLYDSMSMQIETKKVATNLTRYVQDLYYHKYGSNIQESWIAINVKECVQQNNAWDCGVYTIANAISVCLDMDHMSYGREVQEKMDKYREKLCYDSRNGLITSFYLN